MESKGALTPKRKQRAEIEDALAFAAQPFVKECEMTGEKRCDKIVENTCDVLGEKV